MLQYLVILLDDTSTSYCHYGNDSVRPRRLMDEDTLKKGILFGMKENLLIQFVFPEYKLPDSYRKIIGMVDHTKIIPYGAESSDADVVVYNSLNDVVLEELKASGNYVLRVSKEELFSGRDMLEKMVGSSKRVNVIFKDLDSFQKDDFEKYRHFLESLVPALTDFFVQGKSPQLNILTDRMMLGDMNDCGAGDRSITLAPDGRFYVCPAFYLAAEDDNFGIGKSKVDAGNLEDGLQIKNQRLYKAENSPICRLCDAFQCKRCVWLNRKMTYEVNIPGHEQCVISHLERNSSRNLIMAIRQKMNFMPGKEIRPIDYLDPFETI